MSPTGLSLDAATDSDYFAFSVARRSLIAAAATPVGSSYFVGPTSGSTTVINTLSIRSLSVNLLTAAGGVLATSPPHAPGARGDTAPTALDLGTYLIRVFSPAGSADDVQRYALSLSAVSAPPCFADFNGDGGIDGADLADFFATWESGGASADVNQDGGIDGADVDAFFAAWEAGGCE